ncbi:imidazole glycerol phosphate synthase subunit HisH [Bradyrhizobium guangdongense]
MICIVDYGLGNVTAFASVYNRANMEVSIARKAADLKVASKLILPGVGHFDHAMRLLQASGMRESLDELVLRGNVPVIGVCVGMQILGRSSEEGNLPGLGWIDADVKSFKTSGVAEDMPVPHMGWNDVRPRASELLFDGLQNQARFYFLHSYYMECDRPENVVATSHYGAEFACAVRSAHIHGVQFHPEKSHHFGNRLLTNFAAL